MNRFEALHTLGLEEGASDEDITMALYGLEKAVGEFDFSDIPALQTAIDNMLDLKIHQASELVPGGESLEECAALVQAIGITQY